MIIKEKNNHELSIYIIVSFVHYDNSDEKYYLKNILLSHILEYYFIERDFSFITKMKRNFMKR
jgi:hypothetical protein